MLKMKLQAYRVAGTFFRVAGEMGRLPTYFDNPGLYMIYNEHCRLLALGGEP